MLSPTFVALASFSVLISAAPYPSDLTIPTPTVSQTYFFGNKDGNFMPSRTLNGPQPAAKGGVVTNPAVAVTSINNNDGSGAGTDVYLQYNGRGTTADGWPAKTAWVSFTQMFNNNKGLMGSSCAQFGQANNSPDETGKIYDAIQAAASATKLDHRFILAIALQESGGCVRAPTTNYGVRNPGIMQDHNGDGTCNDSDGSTQGGAVPHQVQNPCPSGVINLMISTKTQPYLEASPRPKSSTPFYSVTDLITDEGAAGTASGDGLAQTVNESGASDVSAWYKGARIYNSGSVDPSGDLGKGVATHCYSSDIANRLTGWVSAPHNCNLDG